MGKSRIGGQDFELLDRLKKENRELKRQLKALRKSLDRIDYQHLNDLIEAQEAAHIVETPVEYKSKTERNEERWKCFSCTDGVLRLVIFQKPGGALYFRRCDCCGKRTKAQKYHDGIEGVK